MSDDLTMQILADESGRASTVGEVAAWIDGYKSGRAAGTRWPKQKTPSRVSAIALSEAIGIWCRLPVGFASYFDWAEAIIAEYQRRLGHHHE